MSVLIYSTIFWCCIILCCVVLCCHIIVFALTDVNAQRMTWVAAILTQQYHDYLMCQFTSPAPLLARDLLLFPLADILHKLGVSMRYIGYLRKCMNDYTLRAMLLYEMTYRVLKRYLLGLLRQTAGAPQDDVVADVRYCCQHIC